MFHDTASSPTAPSPVDPQADAWPPPADLAPARRLSKRAVFSLVFSVLGFVFLPVFFHFIGIMLGQQAQTRMRHGPHLRGHALARAGILLGWIGIVASILLVLLVVLAKGLYPL